MFQSSSSPKAGCNAYLNFKFDTFLVSILIQPEGWMQFQFLMEELLLNRFNPHPARRLDAIKIISEFVEWLTVSILIQPEGWMQ